VRRVLQKQAEEQLAALEAHRARAAPARASA